MRERLRAAPELLDEVHHDPDELRESMDHVAAVNRYLGGTRALLAALSEAFPDVRRPLRILDAGCGSGDAVAAIEAWARRSGREVTITACDVHTQMLQLARARLGTHAVLVQSDIRALPFADDAFDAALLSLTLHHFEADEPVDVLHELGRTAGCVIVNELERGLPNYMGARLLAATLWRGNRLTRHDGPLSVLRAFNAAELRALAQAASLERVVVRRRFFYRLVLTARSV